jgi:hypothetical protein
VEPLVGITALSESFFTRRKLGETTPFTLAMIENRKNGDWKCVSECEEGKLIDDLYI